MADCRETIQNAHMYTRTEILPLALCRPVVVAPAVGDSDTPRICIK